MKRRIGDRDSPPFDYRNAPLNMLNTLLSILAAAATQVVNAQHSPPAPPDSIASTQSNGGDARSFASSALGTCFARPPAYPVEALRNEETGRVLVDMRVDRAGFIDKPTLVRSSGFAVLDQTTLQHLASCIASFQSSNQPQLPAGRYVLPMLWQIVD